MPKVIGQELADADALGRAAAGRLVKDTLLVAVHRPSNLHALRSYEPWSGEIERIQSRVAWAEPLVGLAGPFVSGRRTVPLEHLAALPAGETVLYGLDPGSYYLDVTNTNPWVVTFTPLA